MSDPVNMKPTIYYNDLSLGHVLYPFFSEKPKRFQRLIAFFKSLDFPIAISRKATQDELLSVHSKEYVDHVRAISQQSLLQAFVTNTLSSKIQWYTRVSKGSYLAAQVSAGAVCQAAEDTMSGKTKRSFCVVRPPGHHAGVENGEGFCLFNNIAIGAMSALNNGAKRVAIIDFDRHHGNGTEAIIKHYKQENILLISSFQAGCKYSHDSEKLPNIVPISIPEHSEFSTVKELYEQQALPALYDFKPDLILISAGFDMHVDDPLTNIKLESKDFLDLTRLLVNAANDLCEGRIVSALEGGYDVEALKECVAYHVEALTE